MILRTKYIVRQKGAPKRPLVELLAILHFPVSQFPRSLFFWPPPFASPKKGNDKSEHCAAWRPICSVQLNCGVIRRAFAQSPAQLRSTPTPGKPSRGRGCSADQPYPRPSPGKLLLRMEPCLLHTTQVQIRCREYLYESGMVSTEYRVQGNTCSARKIARLQRSIALCHQSLLLYGYSPPLTMYKYEVHME